MKRKCLHIITGLGTGGAERQLYNLLSGGLAMRFDSQVVSLSSEGTFGGKIRELACRLLLWDCAMVVRR